MFSPATPITLWPSPRLRDIVSHYWLRMGQVNQVYVALPDGSVDWVVQVSATAMDSWVYGTPTARVDIALDRQCYYLGIRFKPGQSRHFIHPQAWELTDGHADADGVLRGALLWELQRIADCLVSARMADLAQQLDRVLERYLAMICPDRQPIDRAIQAIEAAGGAIPIREAAEVFGQSHRQFERVFLATVGVSAKTFATIIRFQQAAQRLAVPGHQSLSSIAAELQYTDQSHMSHDFKRLAGVSPVQFCRDHVAFLQDIHPGHV